MTLTPLTWTKVRAGAYTATDDLGNVFLIRKSGHDNAIQRDVWSIFVNDEGQTIDYSLRSAKRWVEAIARKHSKALKPVPAATEYVTRNLTVDESAALMRKLGLAVGHTTAEQALRVIAELGAGIFMAEAL